MRKPPILLSGWLPERDTAPELLWVILYAISGFANGSFNERDRQLPFATQPHSTGLNYFSLHMDHQLSRNHFRNSASKTIASELELE